MVGLLLLVLAPAACGDSTGDGDGDNGDDAGAGGSSGEAGNDTGGSTTGGSTTGGRGGTSTGGRGGTSAGDGGDGGDAGDGVTGGVGGEAGDMGGAGAGGEPDTGGTDMGGTAGAGMGGGAGVAGGGAGMGGGAGVAGGGAGMGGGAGVAGGGTGGGAGTAGAGGTICTESPIRCALGTCPTGTGAAFYQSSSSAIAIPDGAATNPALMPITITTAGLVSRIVVQTNITHTYTGDLDITLLTPYGGRDFSSDNGGTGDNYANTIFAESGATVVTAGAAPFAGVYRPEQELASLSGVPLAGTYRLSVADDASGDTGQLTSFTLGVCQCLASSGNCEFGLACLNGIDDDGDAQIDCLDPNCATYPGCPKPESACGDGIDNDADNLVDCNDPSCSWACSTLTSCTGTNKIFAYGAKNLPQTISTAGSVRLAAPIGVDAAGTIVSAAVRFNAAHTFDADLTLMLTSPSGVSRVLSSTNGSSGDNYVNTVFIDSASCVIGTTACNTAPFTGSFGPEEPFSAWTSQSARGIWPGDLLDAANNDGGNFTELTLALCLAP